MNKKRVLIIEDNEWQRETWQKLLEACGFEVYSAGNAADARRLAEHHWEELDVAVLDMLLDKHNEVLEEHNERPTTGANIAIEFREKKTTFPPETLIYTGYDDPDYYRLAIRLGAAAYLSKSVYNFFDMVQHVRVLALRHALNAGNPKTAFEIARIARQSRSQPEAIVTFCQKVFKPEFEACVGASFICLFTEDNTTRNCADNVDLPAGSNAFYHTLQVLAHGKENSTEPFIFDANELGRPPDGETALLYRRLNNAAFLPLSISNNLRLSIGILQDEKNENLPVPIHAKELCKILGQYLRPTVLENIMNTWTQWTELHATRISTAKLCLSVGQEIKDSLQTAELERLEDLADDMNETGQLLIQIENTNSLAESEAVSLKEIVTAAWELIAESDETLATKLELQGDCVVQAQRIDLEIIFSRLLQWLAYRSTATPPDVNPLITIKFKTTTDGVTITLEDHSRRLPKRLRDGMFAPFTQAITTPFPSIESAKPETGEAGDQIAKRHADTGRSLPLYLAKMLVEGRYHGVLEDRSDEITERSYGHRILMRFPVTSNEE